MAFKAAMALVTGNTVVLKPAPTTPLSRYALANSVPESFLPALSISSLTRMIWDNILPSIPILPRFLSLVLHNTGKKVMASAASTIKRLTLELGGNDAAIVLGDVDPKNSRGHIGGATMNAGQVCLAIKRVYAHNLFMKNCATSLRKVPMQRLLMTG